MQHSWQSVFIVTNYCDYIDLEVFAMVFLGGETKCYHPRNFWASVEQKMWKEVVCWIPEERLNDQCDYHWDSSLAVGRMRVHFEHGAASQKAGCMLSVGRKTTHPYFIHRYWEIQRDLSQSQNRLVNSSNWTLWICDKNQGRIRRTSYKTRVEGSLYPPPKAGLDRWVRVVIESGSRLSNTKKSRGRGSRG